MSTPRFWQASKSGKSPWSRFVSFRSWLMVRSACEEVYPCDSALPTVRGVRDRRMFIRISEEKGVGEYFEDGRGVSTVSVRIKPELAGGKGELINILDICLCDTLARGSG